MDITAAQTTPQTGLMPEFRGMNRAQADFAAMNARQIAQTGGKEIEFGFADFIDLINPLQHIPIVGSLYREITGDEIQPAVKVAGSGIIGGPLGLISGALNAIYEAASGEEITQTVAGLFGDDKAAAPQTEQFQLADIQWNAQPAGFALAATPLPDQKQVAAAAPKPADAAQVAAAEPPKPSALFNSLNKGVMPTSHSAPPQIANQFNPTAAQFHGVQPAAVKTPTEAAANDTTSAPQSDFAKKMMEALDRYQAAKNTTAPAAVPQINQGL